MKTRYDWSLFVEGDAHSIAEFRSHFHGGLVGADPDLCVHALVQDGKGQMAMYSLCGVDEVNHHRLADLSRQWPKIRLVLIYQTHAHGMSVSGFAMFEHGKIIRYAGSIETSQRSVFGCRCGEDIDRRYRQHVVDHEVFDVRPPALYRAG